ncbi:YwqG family protein [Streptomyces sp. NBC_01341]|uniref:DUF1963 domain-containing protein n=1 Tax=Streptomyces sp. NBC_01341 TaxID=2903831 RepID=UPI002E0F4C60|nr:YwqG family protein [Streptomyces sp. NBC_01341]
MPGFIRGQGARRRDLPSQPPFGLRYLESEGSHCTFGRPDTAYTLTVSPRDADHPSVHLLQPAEDTELGWGWGDAGTLYFTIPVTALATGDFRKAVAQVRCC